MNSSRKSLDIEFLLVEIQNPSEMEPAELEVQPGRNDWV